MADNKQQPVSDDVVAAGAVVNVMEYLHGIDFPANREQIETYARKHGADESALEEIRYLPADREYKDPAELIAAIGQEVKGLHES
ncbi:MAG TPA: DUF2795 domain-containing protein [Candidatus Thermoplasmatota archaeon]|nr:DUF2795 domain-containing protein [Candidatus Thermoplasmatota archaeon]